MRTRGCPGGSTVPYTTIARSTCKYTVEKAFRTLADEIELDHSLAELEEYALAL